MVQAAIATRTVNFRKFKTYVEDRARNERRALSVIEENGVATAFERCRMLARLINADLSMKTMRFPLFCPLYRFCAVMGGPFVGMPRAPTRCSAATGT